MVAYYVLGNGLMLTKYYYFLTANVFYLMAVVLQ
jgi:hypothetical protein